MPFLEPAGRRHEAAAGSAVHAALRRCIGIDPADFAQDTWGRRPLLTRSRMAGRDFADLLSLADVDELLSVRGLRTPFLRLARDGAVIDPSTFTGSGGVGAEIADQVRDDRVFGLLMDGSTVVLQALHRVWPPLITFGRELGADLGHPAQINAYITPAQNKGFSAHYDVHDVFVLQIAGEKRWLIHEPVLDAPLRTQPWNGRAAAVAARATEPPFLDTILRPGDALYLPRGWLHSAAALGEISGHLTVGVHQHDRAAILAALAELAGEEVELRRSLPLGVDVADPHRIRADVGATADLLAGWLSTADPAALADRVAEKLAARSGAAARPEPVAPLAQIAAVAGLDQETVLRPRAGVVWSMTPSAGGAVTVRLADRRITFPAGTAAALKAALLGDVIRVADLPGLDPDDRLVLARRLLREALCVPMAR